jgi:hypothetical protein
MTDEEGLRQRLCLDLETMEQERRLLNRATNLRRSIEARVANLLQSSSDSTETERRVNSPEEPFIASESSSNPGRSRNLIARCIAQQIVLEFIKNRVPAT